MRKRTLKTLLLTTTLMGLFTVGANAEWRQIEEGKWNYYDSNNNLVKNQTIDNEYYVDDNGLWLDPNVFTRNDYNGVIYRQDTGEIHSIMESVNCRPTSSFDNINGRIYYNLIYVKKSDFGKYDGMRNYHVINDNGTWKIERIENTNVSK